ncbi:MAG: signal peptidase II [Cloacibacillus porcorum]|uniref:signal peptidase II n=1 Tax=Cloacibacillus porcorum TaxID=1197717 RepID=UPI0023548022|nr:signal peptidase II [Cloacibacillus porcorum]MCI5864390.1 signal peptidase II [Cloacibacillus porcorum]
MREYISSKAALICTAAFFISLFADRLTKYAALRLGWNTSLNAGLSFGLFSETGSSVVTAASAVILLILLILCVHCARWRGPLFRLGGGFMLGGAAGNLMDRLSCGQVIDWLPLPMSEIFFRGGLWINAADIFLSAGAAMIFFALWKEHKSGS